MKKRVLFAALSLLLMLALLPASQAQAANPLSELHIGGVSVGGVSGGAITLPTTQGYYTYGTNAAQTASNQAALPAASAYTWALQNGADGYVLTLNGLGGGWITASTMSAEGYHCGIYARGDLSIVAIGSDNSIRWGPGETRNNDSYGIYVSGGALSISGDSAAALSISTYAYAPHKGYGVKCAALRIEGLNLGIDPGGGNAIGVACTDLSFNANVDIYSGVQCSSLTMSGGEVDITAETAGGVSLDVSGPITISGGELEASNSILIDDAVGIRCRGLTVTDGTVRAVGQRICIENTGNAEIRVSGGIVYAYISDGSQENNAREETYGIYSTGPITVSSRGQIRVSSTSKAINTPNAIRCTGIYARPSITVTAGGRIDVHGTEISNQNHSALLQSSRGIDTPALTVDDATLVSHGGDTQACGSASESIGICTQMLTTSGQRVDGRIAIVLATGSASGGKSYGISCSNVSLLNGTLCFKGQTRAILTTSAPGIVFSDANQPNPNWYQWRTTSSPDPFTPAAIAQFDNNSALYTHVEIREATGTTPTASPGNASPGNAHADIPKTGDGSTPGAWLAAMTMALAGLLTLAVLRRRRKRSAR